jgi:glycosyltransferase involved in cell wall biosynthesis
MLNKKSGGRHSLLIITFTVPYPPSDGGKIAIFSEVDYLRHHFDITLLFDVHQEAVMNDVAQLRRIWPNVRIETVERWAKATKEKSMRSWSWRAAQRAWGSIRRIARRALMGPLQRQLTRPAGRDENIAFTAAGFLYLDRDFINKLGSILQRQYDAVFVEHSYYLSAVNLLPASTLRIFVEIESRFSILQDIVHLGPERDCYSKYVVETCRSYEYSLMSRFDAVIALTPEDRERIARAVPGQEIIVSPFPVLDSEKKAVDPSSWSPKKLIFLGSEIHGPNKDGLIWFVDHILPLLHEKSTKLYITGNWSQETRERYGTNHSIVFTGFIRELGPLIRDSVGIVPIRIGGGGIRSKVIESLAYGIPVVSTRLGAAGVLAENEKQILIRDNEADFAAAIDWIFARPAEARKIARSGLDVIRANYTYEATGRQKLEFLNQALYAKAVTRDG